VITLLSARSSFLVENGPNLKLNWVECCYRSPLSLSLSLCLCLRGRCVFFPLSLFLQAGGCFMEIGCRTRAHTEKKAQSTPNVTLISVQVLFLVLQFLNNALNVCVFEWKNKKYAIRPWLCVEGNAYILQTEELQWETVCDRKTPLHRMFIWSLFRLFCTLKLCVKIKCWISDALGTL